ncbi:MAG: hypothetical protein OXI22_03935 [Defluviicoccus sp.]|nr:hypothetical protein [Defluviicoccus sp.]
MAMEEDIRARLQQLLDESTHLSQGNENGQCTNPTQMQACSGWLTAAQNLVHLICTDSNAPYRSKADRVALGNHGYMIHERVGELAAVLKALRHDADLGLLASVADRARAETFDDFLDHADVYLKNNQKNEAGVIAGVVFEDTVRRVCRKNMIEEKGNRIDDLISNLSSKGEISAIKAKRARAAAHVRTKATHAQWDEFELEDVRATIEFTREFIVSKLDV